MKIWIVKHHQDNGEYYEDHYEWDSYACYSSLEGAYVAYCNSIMNDYRGEYSIIEKTLDTQEEEELEKSPWGGYTNTYSANDEDYQHHIEYCNWCAEQNEIESDRKQLQGETLYPTDLWDAEYDSQQESVSYSEELAAEAEWMQHKGEQYEILESIEQDRLEDKLKEINAVWESLGMLG